MTILELLAKITKLQHENHNDGDNNISTIVLDKDDPIPYMLCEVSYDRNDNAILFHCKQV